jgi:environmental stress-induced protein Ves
MSARRIRAGEYRRVRWKNGGGWTTELAAAPAGTEAFDWRISIAEVESDGAFSTFPGCDRHIALLDGPGMQIDFDESPPLVLDQRLKFLQFSGEWTARGRLLGGAVRDFNVIVRRAAFQAEVLHRPLVGPMVFLPEAKTTWFIYVAGGRAELKDVAGMDLEAGDSLLLERDGEARNRVLSGGGEVVLVKLTGL